MLLRSSRKASYLTKEAIIGRLASGLVRGGARTLEKGLGLMGRGVKGTLGGVGRVARRFPRTSLAVTGGAAFAIPEVQQGYRQAAQGLTPQSQYLRRASGYRY